MKVINTDQCSGESMNGITHLFKQLAFLDMTEKTHGGQLQEDEKGLLEMNCVFAGKWTRSDGGSAGKRHRAAVKQDTIQNQDQSQFYWLCFHSQ